MNTRAAHDRHRFPALTAAAVVVANMIGTGVFTSLGFQLQALDSPFALLALWAVGGLTAFCGALCYAELGARLPRSGGEYQFISHCWHPSLGFAAGWVSATIGFAAPTALAAMTFAAYLTALFPALNATLLAGGLILLLTLFHAGTHRRSSRTQQGLTLIKLSLLLAFILTGWWLADTPQPVSFGPDARAFDQLFSGAFAVSLIYVNYAYNGWNAATYLSSELPEPRRTLPRVLLSSTAVVTLLYLLLNATFLHVAPMDALRGRLEVGVVAARWIFGETGALLMGITLSLLLTSTVSAMILAGPRVLQVIGEDYPLFRRLAATNADGIPARAIWLQSAISLIFVLTGTFQTVLIFSGAALALCNLLAVSGLVRLRLRRKQPFDGWQAPLHPLPALVFMALMGWTLFYLFHQQPVQAWGSLALFASGVLAWVWVRAECH